MSAKCHFAECDVVRLVAGGPDMTVEGPGPIKGHVWCTWTIGKIFHGGSFDEGVLVRVDGPFEDMNSEFSDRRYHTPRVEYRVEYQVKASA